MLAVKSLILVGEFTRNCLLMTSRKYEDCFTPLPTKMSVLFKPSQPSSFFKRCGCNKNRVIQMLEFFVPKTQTTDPLPLLQNMLASFKETMCY